MYAYSLAAAVTGIPHNVQKRLESVLIAQPPADDQLVRLSPEATFAASRYELVRRIKSDDCIDHETQESHAC